MKKGRTAFHVPRRWWLCSLNLSEQLIEHPKEAVVVRTPKDLGDECSTLDQKFNGEFEAHKYKFGLAVSVLNPSGTNVGSTVM